MPATDSRDRILARIREALQLSAPPRHREPGSHGPAASSRPPLATTEPAAGTASPSQAWLPHVPADLTERISLFARNSEDLRTEFHLSPDTTATAAILGQFARDSNWKRAAAHHFPLGEGPISELPLPITWTDGGYAIPELESVDAAITGCECLIAQTGSILITARSSGGRALSVLPPHHIVIASRSQVVGDLSEALAAARESHGGETPAFLSFITGPSRTGDIERIMVLGAHGPKRLTVILQDD